MYSGVYSVVPEQFEEAAGVHDFFSGRGEHQSGEVSCEFFCELGGFLEDLLGLLAERHQMRSFTLGVVVRYGPNGLE